MIHKHHYRLRKVGSFAYRFVCICDAVYVVDKYKFRQSCTGR